MDFFKVFYFFTNDVKNKFFNEVQFDLNQRACLLWAFIVLLLCVCAFVYFFYFKYTQANAERATQSALYKTWLAGMIVCFILTELSFAFTDGLPSNGNILYPFLGKNENIFVFSLINSCVYFTLFFALFSYIFKSNSRNAKRVWFFPIKINNKSKSK